jgi:hypothetical protein
MIIAYITLCFQPTTQEQGVQSSISIKDFVREQKSATEKKREQQKL